VNILLLERIKNLGNLGDKVQVKAGFARNFLIPKGKAVVATAANIAYFASRKAELLKKANDQLAIDQARAEKIQNVQLIMPVRVRSEGKLYGSIGAVELAAALNEAVAADIKKQEIHLPDGPIRVLGNYQVKVSLHHGDIIANVAVSIVAE